MTFYVLRHHHFYKNEKAKDALDQLLIQGMSPDPKHRYLTMQELKKALNMLYTHKNFYHVTHNQVLAATAIICYMLSFCFHLYDQNVTIRLIQTLRAQHKYADIIIFMPHDLQVYQQFIEYQTTKYHDQGRIKALQTIIELEEYYRLQFSFPIKKYLFYECIMSKDLMLYQYAVKLMENETNTQIHMFVMIIKAIIEDVPVKETDIYNLKDEILGQENTIDEGFALLTVCDIVSVYNQIGVNAGLDLSSWLLTRVSDTVIINSLKRQQTNFQLSLLEFDLNEHHPIYQQLKKINKDDLTMSEQHRYAWLLVESFQNDIDDNYKQSYGYLLDEAASIYKQLAKLHPDDKSVRSIQALLHTLKERWG